MGHERRVRSVANVDLTGLQEAADILATEAVTDGSDLLHAQVLAHVLDGLFDDRIHVAGLVLGEPRGEVDLARVHVANGDLVTLEQIGDNGQEAIVGELVGQELGVGEDAEDVGQEENGLVGALVLGVRDVGVDWETLVNWGGFPIRVASHAAKRCPSVFSSLSTNSPPSMFFTSPAGVPSCLKPEAQQAAGGLEAMMYTRWDKGLGK